MKKHFLCAAFLVLVCCTPQEMEGAIKRIQVEGSNVSTKETFNPDTLYSRWAINSRLGSYSNKSSSGNPRLRGLNFTSPYGVTKATMDSWDYVPGLVARAVLKASEYYASKSFSTPWLEAVYDWADSKANGKDLFTSSKKDDIDWLNAAKIFADLYKQIGSGTAGWCETQMTAAVTLLRDSHGRIPADDPLYLADAAGGFWHKGNYQYQMWCDGQYMGPAMWAEWLGTFKNSGYAGWATEWADIANQLDICCKYTYSVEDHLFFHAMNAYVNTASCPWEVASGTQHSKEAWGRGAGWLFAALVDILEYMPAGIDVKANFTYPDGVAATDVDSKTRLTYYLKLMADGLAARQDASGCWPQLLRYDAGTTPSGASNANYLESSASSMFCYAYLKAVRLGLLSGTTIDKTSATVTYATVAKRGFEGVVNNFVCKQSDGSIFVIQSCESAGLDDDRAGDAAYYLGDNNDTRINDATEGKCLGPFILAATEYERAYPPAAAPESEPAGGECRCLRVTITE